MRPVALPAISALLGGLLYALGPLRGHAWAGALALAPLAWVIDRGLAVGRAALTGLVMGIVALAIGLSWMVPTLSAFLEVSMPAAWLAATLFFVWHGAQLSLFGALLAAARHRGWSVTWMLTPAWLCSELVWPGMFHDWLGLALQAHPAAIQMADIGGVPLVSALLALTNAAVVAIATRRDWTVVAATASAWLLCLGYGHHRVDEIRGRMAAAPRARVALVQANVSPAERLGAPERNLVQHLRLSRKAEGAGAPLDLVVWPETAMLRVDDARAFGARVGAPLMFGGVEHAGDLRHNTAFLVTDDATDVYRYRKHRLVAFGEFVPGSTHVPGIVSAFPNTTKFSPGQSLAPAIVDGHRLSPLICYEDVLPDHVRDVVRSAQPEALVVLSNDGWFGESAEPAMHHAWARFRAVEHHVYVVRATQTGVTGVFDALGEPVAQLAAFEPGVLTAEIAWMEPSGRYATLGPWPHWLALPLTLLLCWRRRKLDSRAPDPAGHADVAEEARRTDL